MQDHGLVGMMQTLVSVSTIGTQPDLSEEQLADTVKQELGRWWGAEQVGPDSQSSIGVAGGVGQVLIHSWTLRVQTALARGDSVRKRMILLYTHVKTYFSACDAGGRVAPPAHLPHPLCTAKAGGTLCPTS